MRVEDEQRRLLRPRFVLPCQLTAGDVRNVGQGGVPRILLDEPAHMLVDQNPAETLLQLGRQPAFTAGFRACEYQDFHARNAGSARHSRQPCTAMTANNPYSVAVRYRPL
ncbi:hypothetical protein D3C78_1585630 [compost metagenome]